MNRPFELMSVQTLTLLLLLLRGPASGAEGNAQPTSTIDGTWRWSFTMPDGTVAKPKLLLEMEEGKLTGTTSFRPGSETAITNAMLVGNQVRFQVVRERDGQPIVTTYWGAWSGKIIKGKVESNWAGAKQVYDWQAERAHEGAEGIWKWIASFRGRKYEARVKLEQEGEKLTGYLPGFGRVRRIPIKNGSIKNGDIYFEVERGTGENKVVTVYKGKQTGDTIKGTIESEVDGKKQEVKWEAKRPD